MFFNWVGPLVRRGAAGQLNYDDLLPVPANTTPKASTSALWRQWTKTCAAGHPSLLRALLAAFGGPYYRLAALKFVNDGLTFAGTMLLNLLVQHLEAAHYTTPNSCSGSSCSGGSSSGSSSSCSVLYSSLLLPSVLPSWCEPGSACWGYSLAGLLGASVAAKAIIGSHYNYGLSLVTIRLRSGVMGVLFRASLLSRSTDAAGACAGDINTLMAVDAGRLANLALSVQELWSLPLQIIAAMTLLYLQVRTAFIAGVLLCVALIPINRLIAQRIQAASVSMMAAKDARVGLMGELLRNLTIVKALGWEDVLRRKVMTHRTDELRALAVRKYLDALCVYFWAATQLLLSGTTFGLMVLLGQPLRPSVVFTSLALFAVLISPLNALPWVINGVVEAVVSLKRIQAYLLLPQRCPEWAYSPQQLPSILALQQQQQQQQQQLKSSSPAAAGSRSGGSSGGSGCCGRGNKQRKQHQDAKGEGGGGQGGGGGYKQQQQQIGHSLWLSAGQASLGCEGVSSKQSGSKQVVQQAAPHALDSSAAVQFCDASFAWKQGQPPCLSELRLSIPSGCLTAVVGEVGAGKSSLLAAILGELDLVEGHALLPQHCCHHHQQQQQPPSPLPLLPQQQQQQQQAYRSSNNSQQPAGQRSHQQQHHPQQQQHLSASQTPSQSQVVLLHPHRIGYVSQSPWLMRGSVRDNVLIGQPYDAEVMGEIYHAVGLDTDLAAMPAGDLTPVGEGGAALSGGQRLRVALARALYQPHTRLFLFDDLLASLDGHVAQWIIRHTLFGGLLSGATVVMVTKHPTVIQSAQLVVALQQGRVAFTGSPSAYAHWKAQQQTPVAVVGGASGVSGGGGRRGVSGGGGVGVVSNGWTPLVRHTVAPSSSRQPQQQQQQQEPSSTAAYHPGHSNSSSNTGGAGVNSSSSSSGGGGGGGVGGDHASAPVAVPMSPDIPAGPHTPHPDLADFLASPTSPSSSSSSPTSTVAAMAAMRGVTAAATGGVTSDTSTAAAAEISLDSEDVPVSELMLAGGHGVWAPHASLAPQLNVISEEEGASVSSTSGRLDSAGSSGVLLDGCCGSSGGSSGSSSDGSWEVVGPMAGGSSSDQQQQQGDQQQQQGDVEVPATSAAGGGGGSSHSGQHAPQPAVSAAAAAAAAAATVAAAAGGSRAGRRVSFSSDVISADDEKQQQQQQQLHQESDHHHHRQQQQGQATTQVEQQQQQQQEGGSSSPEGNADDADADAAGGGGGDAEEVRAVGAVGWRVYGSYFKAVGVAMCVAVLASLVAMQATKNGVDLWVTSSLSHNTTATSTVHNSSDTTSSDTSSSSSLFVPHSLGSANISCRQQSFSSSSSSSSCSNNMFLSAHTGFMSSSLTANLAAAGGPIAGSTQSAGAGAAGAAAAGLQAFSFGVAAASGFCGMGGTCWRSAASSTAGRCVCGGGSSKNSSSNRSLRVPVSRKLLLLEPHSTPPKPLPQPSTNTPSLLYQHHHQQQQPQNPATSSSLDPDMIRFLKGLGIISALNTLATLARAFSFAAAGMAAARSIHRQLLGAVLGAPLSAFDNQPAGRLLNRFSSDTSVVDDSLPFILNILLANAVSLAGLLAVLLYSQPLLLLVVLPLGGVYRRLQLFYRSSARELRRLEAVGLSPLYSLYSDTAAGAATLRAASAQGVFVQRFTTAMEPYQAACVNNTAASNWLSTRLQLLAAVLLSAVAALAAVVAAAAAAGDAPGDASNNTNPFTTTPVAAGGVGSVGSVGSPLLHAVSSLAASLPALFGGSRGGNISAAAAGGGFSSGSNGSSSSSSSSWIGSTFRVDLLGLALAYCLPIVNLLNGLLTSSAETEQDMVGVERIAALVESLGGPETHGCCGDGGGWEDEEEEEEGMGGRRQRQQQQQQQRRLVGRGGGGDGGLLTPLLLNHEEGQEQQQQRGGGATSESAAAAAAAAGTAAEPAALQLVDVFMRYRPGLPPALRGVSLSVPVGGKLGVCGRTGAGKSSLMSVLLRLRPIEAGVIRVFGQDAKTLSLRDLRSHFAVVPQQPVLFQGSLRENLDPWGRATDEQLAVTLQAVHMWAPLCRIALHKKLLGHSTYLMARRAGSLVGGGGGPGGGSTTATTATGAAAAQYGGNRASPSTSTAVRPQQQRHQPALASTAGSSGDDGATADSGTDDAELAAITAEWSTRRRAAPLIPQQAHGDEQDDEDHNNHSADSQGEARSSRNRSTSASTSTAAVGAAGAVGAAIVIGPLNSRMLEEGAALALGAAAGAVDAARQRSQRGTSYSSSSSSTWAAAAAAASVSASRDGTTGGKRLSFHRVVQAVVGSSPRLSNLPLVGGGGVFGRRLSASSGGGGAQRESSAFVLPPVPMHPADKVLSMQVGSGPSALSLSAGQAQLVCVARCLLSGAPLVLLDEATAAVDPRTAALIHQVLHEQFDAVAPRTYGSGSNSSSRSPSLLRQQHSLHQHHQHHQQPQQRQPGALSASRAAAAAATPGGGGTGIRPTVIQIAHELSAIMSYDTVAVMAAGQVVEMGSPQQLAAQEGSRFSRLLLQEGHS